MTGRVTARCGFATPALVVLLAVTALVVVAPARATDPTDSILIYGCDPPLPRVAANCALWHTSPVTLRWTLVDPNFVPMPNSDCDTRTVSSDTTGMNVTCTVSDLASTQVSKTATMRVDQTAPAMATPAPDRPPDHTGWWNHAVKWAFSGTDATSGMAGCDTITYSGPDVPAGDVPGTCTDVAGNKATAHATVNYDATAPTVTAITPERSADQSGWWNHAVRWTLSGSDATSGIAGCDTVTYSGPDSATGTVSGDCRDVAGNSKTGSTSVKYDATAPNVTGATSARPADKNGWWNHAVTMAFQGSDATSGIAGCDSVTYSGPDTGTGSVSGACRDAAGNSKTGSASVKYDATAPNVTDATPDRGADQNGWWNHAVRWTFQGNDATSGLSDCDTMTYSGPDSATGTVTGSCRDNAGNAKSLGKTLKYDGTGPSISGASPSRPADNNGWWNHSVTWNFQGTDGLSGMAGCDNVAYAGPDSGTGDVSGACRDLAGNSTTGHAPIKYDATPPTTPTGSPARPADHKTWFNHPVNVAFGATDTTSGIASCDTGSYSGPDQASASVSGTCRDNAGNTKSGSLAINYDATPPTVNVGLPQRAADSNGWWNHPIQFAFSGTDATSDIESCDTPTYSGPDAASASVTGACRDNAGNSASRQVTGIKYDSTPPSITGIGASRPADRAGWWNKPVTVTATGSDARSGIGPCAGVVYSGPDNPTAAVQAGCRDIAGNTASTSMPIKYDATPPTITSKTSERAPDHGVWFNKPVKVTFAGTDATSLLDSCDAPTYAGPDGANIAVSGACRDNAGNAMTGTFQINYDATPPTITSKTFERAPDHGVWFNKPVKIKFDGTDTTSNIASCDSTTYSGPDSASISISGQCQDNAGNSATGSAALKYDSTPPTVNPGLPQRAPDHNGWWNHPIQFKFTGSDATSDIESCDAPTYSGPDATGGSLTGACRDNAGNSASRQVTGIQYDASPPTLTTLPAEVGSNQVVLHWKASADTVDTQVIRSPGIGTAAASTVYTSDSQSFTDPGVRNDVTYTYSINTSDVAGNIASATVIVTPTGAPPPAPDAAPAPVRQAAPTQGVETPSAPAPTEKVVKLPLLKWKRVKRADYYNVQLYRGNKKLLSTWVKENHFQLRTSWVFQGKRVQLTDARYDWYVWPGFGRRSLRRYGHLITHKRFTFNSQV